MASSSVILVTGLKPKKQKQNHAMPQSSYCTFYKNMTFIEVAYFSDGCYHASHQDRKVSGASVAYASQIWAFAALVLLAVES
jgi:hypothetical protein